MSETRLLFTGVILIFIGAGALALKEAFHQDEVNHIRSCQLLCTPFLGTPASRGRCICDPSKQSDVRVDDE